MLSVGDHIVIDKGLPAREVYKHANAYIVDIKEMGPDYSHSVMVRFRILSGRSAGKSYAFYARHKNRLNDAVINLNDGNPLHRIVIRRKER